MKFSEQSPSLLLVVTALTALLFPGLLARGTAESSATTLTEPRHTVPGDVINEVRLDLEQQKALGLRTEKLYPERIAARATAFGTVQDPIALTDAVSALHVAEAAMRASSASHRRAQLLHSKRQNVSTQDVERLAARASAERSQFEQAQRRLLSVWGRGIAGHPDIEAFVESLVAGSSALVRIDLAPDQVFLTIPDHVLVTTLGTTEHGVDARLLGRAPNINPARQGPGYFFLVDHPPATIAPGAAVTAHIEATGPGKAGVRIPRSAVIHALGATWVYVQRDAERFVRLRITPSELPSGDLVTARGPVAGDMAVVVGAQELWAEEFKSSSDGSRESGEEEAN